MPGIRFTSLIALCLTCALCLPPLLSAEDEVPDRVRFNRDVRPILSDNCFACHGPDANRREADLRLDTEVGLRGADRQPGAVIPNHPERSELWERVTSTDADLKMPPAEFGKELSDRDRTILRRWIEQGAEWEGHWAFTAVRPVTPPAVEQTGGFAVNEIDQFILRGLREQGLQPSPSADRRTLIRRLSFDLTGLPPTPEEVRAFVADQQPGAYERLVERLLESPHHGERLAMWWLDLVRYADSVGYHGDQPVSVSPFRDYVIQSFNDNKPFDVFTVEQLAGDLLPEPTLEHRIASGYNRLGMMSAEGGVQPKEYLAKYAAERVRNVGGTWLGVTLGCCECHDHKYDPFTMRDFYSMESFFGDIRERGLYSGSHQSGRWGPTIQVPTAEQRHQLKAFDDRIAALQRTLDTPTPELAQAQREWESTYTHWTALTPIAVKAEQGTQFKTLNDASVLALGKSPAQEIYRVTLPVPPPGITGLRLEVLPHESLPKQGPGRAGNGNFVLTELKLQAVGSAGARAIELANPSATFEQTGSAGGNPYGRWSIAAAFDQDAKGAKWGWAVMEQVGKPNSALIEIAEPLHLVEGESLELILEQNHDNGGHTLGRFRVLVTTGPKPLRASELLSPELARALQTEPEKRGDEQSRQLAAHYRTVAPLLDPTRRELAKVKQQRERLDKAITTTLVTEAVEPREIRVLPRGNWMDDSGPIVQPAVPATLPQPPESDQRLSRYDLARWIVATDNPLTARVLVNRLWAMYFGAGLSRRLDDLGAQGDWPSHPELLDWLARDLVESGWDLRRTIRLIVLSGTYRQSSEATAEQRESDPYNRWLSHQGRFRLDAEIVRDNALSVSGLLVESVGGVSVKPYQPAGYWAYLNFPTRKWQADSGTKLYRRGLYTHWQRQYLHPALMAFDAPSREECTAMRGRSNTPLQSLVLLNDPSFVEAARVFAEKILKSGGDADRQRIEWAVGRALSRQPAAEETQILLQLLQKHREEYASDTQAAAKLIATGDWAVPSELPVVELAAWTSVARTLLNLHETVTRY